MTPHAPMARLHVVTDDGILADGGFARSAGGVLGSGSDVALHVRGPRTGGQVLYEITRRLRPAATTSGATLLVNDRIDVACLANADGVHLGERSLSVPLARRLLPADARVGVSVHDLVGARAAAAEAADYLVLGTIFPTPSHPGRPGAGVALIRRVSAAVDVPVVAIGGITPERVHACLAAGAHGVAVLRGVWESADPEGAVAGYLEAVGAGSPAGRPS